MQGSVQSPPKIAAFHRAHQLANFSIHPSKLQASRLLQWLQTLVDKKKPEDFRGPEKLRLEWNLDGP